MLRSNTTFFLGNRRVGAGDIVADDDPAVTGRELYFDDVEVTSRPVEEATANPGERRAPKLPTIKEIKEAIGEDPVLAGEALDAELGRGGDARSSLVEHLQKLIADADVNADANADPGASGNNDSGLA